MKLILYLGSFLITMLMACNGSSSKMLTTKNNASGDQEGKPLADFKATGNEPFWSLEIFWGKELALSTMEGLELRLPFQEPETLQANGGLKFSLENTKGSLEVTLLQNNCQDTMADEIFPFEVVVVAKPAGQTSMTLNGCGRYQADARLNDIWALEAIDNNELEAESFARGVPRLEFNLRKNGLTGFSGCNQMSGAVAFHGHKMVFGPLAATRMACAENIATEVAIYKTLQGEVHYTLLPGSLILKGQEHELKFKKVD